METNLLRKWCRICSAEINSGVFVFGEEAKRNFLQAKIRRYLALTVLHIYIVFKLHVFLLLFKFKMQIYLIF